MHTIQRINHDLIIVGAAGHEIPAQLESLQAIRLHLKGVGLIAPVTLVGHLEHLVLLQGFEDQWEVLFAIGNLIKQYLVLDTHAVQHQVAHGERTEKPTAHGTGLFQFISIIDVIVILASVLILNDETKHFLNGSSPFVECPEG